MADLITGQIETLLPALLEALDAATAAQAEVDKIKAAMAAIIGHPQTVKTCWGSVTLNKGRRTIKIKDKALEAQIRFMKENGVSEGRCVESVGEPFISVKRAD